MGLFSHSKSRGSDAAALARLNELEFEKVKKSVNGLFEKAYCAKYRFTYEDLKLEIKEKNPDLKDLQKVEYICDELNELEFDKAKITTEKLKRIMDDSNNLASAFIESNKDPVDKIKEDFKEIDSDKNIAPPAMFKNNATPVIEKIEIDSKKNIAPPAMFKNNTAPVIEKIDKKIKDNAKKNVFSGLFKKKTEPIIEKVDEKIEIDALADDMFAPPESVLMQSKPASPQLPQRIESLQENLSKETPTFSVPETLKKTELADLVKNLERNKKEIRSEINLIETEQVVLEKEKKIEASARKLPKFKLIKTQIDDDLNDLKEKKLTLQKKEAEIDERIKKISSMETELEQKTKQLSNDKDVLNEKTIYLESKEKVIEEIKEDIEKTYQSAVKEIDLIKKDLKTKENAFIAIQEFFNKREDRLHHEESNLLTEKRSYGKLVSNLLGEHIKIAQADLQKTTEIIDVEKKKEAALDSEIDKLRKQFKILKKQKELFDAEIAGKDNYFGKTHSELKVKDKDFVNLKNDLDKKLDLLLSKEKSLKKIEADLDQVEIDARERSRHLEEKEFNIDTAQKDAERLHFNLKNDVIRLRLKERQLEKRLSSFDHIKMDIRRAIAREKSAVTRIEKKLQKKGYTIGRELHQTDKLDKFYDSEIKSVLDLAHAPRENDLQVKNVSYREYDEEIGHPNVLDILRLLNIAKGYLSKGDKTKTKASYEEIQRLFGELEEDEREELYPEITRVFTEKDFVTNAGYTNDNSSNNIDSMIRDFEDSVHSGNLQVSGEIYAQIQDRYQEMPKEDKGKYYGKIMSLYNKLRPVAATM
ncbi:MAG: hypothetical protein ABIJ34_04955 [archaeon]